MLSLSTADPSFRSECESRVSALSHRCDEAEAAALRSETARAEASHAAALELETVKAALGTCSEEMRGQGTYIQPTNE